MNSVHQADALDLAKSLEPHSVDLILCDLPYGITRNKFDKRIPAIPMWLAFKRVIKPGGAIVLTAQQPFSSYLINSNEFWFRTEWIWDKCIITGYMNAKRQPLRRHESVLVFCERQPIYHPQMRGGQGYTAYRRGQSSNYGKDRVQGRTEYEGNRYPTSILVYPNRPTENIHPTQKPQELFEYLIRTYSNPGDLVFDPCAGAGTTALAARNTERNFIVGDLGGDPYTHRPWADIIRERLAEPFTPLLIPESLPSSP